MGFKILNTEDNGRLIDTTIQFVYNNGTQIEKNMNFQNNISISSSVKMEMDRMQELYDGMSTYSSSLSSSIILSTESGSITFTITSMSFDYNEGIVETNFEPSKIPPEYKSGSEYQYHMKSSYELLQSSLHDHFMILFSTGSDDMILQRSTDGE